MRAFGPSATFPALVVALGFAFMAAVALVQVGPAAAIAIGGLPLALIAAAGLLSHGRIILLGAALGLPMSGIAFFGRPIALPGMNLFITDIIVGLALAAWAVAALVGRDRETAPPVPRTLVLGWPFVLFAAAIVTALLRGHYAYGAPLFGQALRLILYAAIVVTLAGLTTGQVYRLLLWVFYPGVAITGLLALYYIATGTSQTDQFTLSTGGARYLGISTTIYCAGALFLALLSLRLTHATRERALHLGVAGLASFCVVVGFGRSVYASVGLICIVLLIASRSIRNSVLAFAPLALPILVLLGLFVARASPELVDAVSNRISAPPAADANVQWRVAASRAVFEQIREQPLVGVGFGREHSFFVETESESVPGLMVPVLQTGSQDPHNGFLYLWAGGGLAALASFALILLAFIWDAVRRLRSNPDPTARLVIIWAAATLGVFLATVASGTTLSSPVDLLTIWALLVLPAVVPYRSASPGAAGRTAAGSSTLDELTAANPVANGLAARPRSLTRAFARRSRSSGLRRCAPTPARGACRLSQIVTESALPVRIRCVLSRHCPSDGDLFRGRRGPEVGSSHAGLPASASGFRPPDQRSAMAAVTHWEGVSWSTSSWPRPPGRGAAIP